MFPQLLVGTRSKIELRRRLLMVLRRRLLIIVGIALGRRRRRRMIAQSRRRLLMERRIEAAPRISAAERKSLMYVMIIISSSCSIIHVVPWIRVVGDLVPAYRFTSATAAAAGARAQRFPRTRRRERRAAADHRRRCGRLLTASVGQRVQLAHAALLANAIRNLCKNQAWNSLPTYGFLRDPIYALGWGLRPHPRP